MTRLIYVANIRLPTEKAHGLQITQNCEAFAAAGADVELWAANRFNTPEMQAIPDLYTHYGVARNFTVRRLPTLDLLPLVPERTDALARVIFYVQLLTFTLSALLRLLFTPADVIYSRDPLVLLAASFVKPKRALVYEAHQLSVGRAGRWLQRTVVRRVGAVITITGRLRDDLLLDEAQRNKFIVAHDGVRAGRFADLPTKAAARRRLGWDADAYIVGYVGRLHTLTQEKGIGTVIDALAQIEGTALALVGGPDDMAQAYRQRWQALGLPDDGFLYTGQVQPDDVPLCIAAFDVCVLAHPFTAHFAYHTSPLKLFEYMASGRAVVTAALPAWADVVRDEHNALLVPPSDVGAFAAAFNRLRDDGALRERLGVNARRDALAHYTWDTRAWRILAHLQRLETASPNMIDTLRNWTTHKLTRERQRAFITRHRSDGFTLDIGAKGRPYADLFPNAVAGDITAGGALDGVFDAHRLPFNEATFDVVLCTEVLEHCHDPAAAVHEFYRVLKPGGVLLLTTRFVYPLHDVPHDYFRFTKYGLRHLCAPFADVHIEPEAGTIETMAILVQRFGFQLSFKGRGGRLLSFLLARLLVRGGGLVKAEYGDIHRRQRERDILASGYYVRAVK